MCWFKIFPFEVLNAGFSGVLLLLGTILLRLTVFRPNLKISFDDRSEDFQRFVPSYNLKTGEVKSLQSWIRLRVENRGFLKLTHAKILCAKVISKPSGKNFSRSITPFELSWAESASDGNLSVIFPGEFEYRFDLAWLEWGLPSQNNLGPTILKIQDFFLARRDRMEGKKLLTGVEHEILLLIANDNFLVPSHFVKLSIQIDVNDPLKVPNEEGLTVNLKIIKQGDWWNGYFSS